MKLCALFLTLIFPAQSIADEWTETDTALELTYMAFHVADWAQSRYIASHQEQYVENNLFIGKHPSEKEVDRYFLLSGIIHAGISYALPSKWRQGFHLITIGLEAGVVAHNYKIGVRLEF